MGENTFWEGRVTVNYIQPDMTNEIRIISANFIDVVKSFENIISKEWFDSEKARLFALAYTNIEEACMWAIKAVNK